MATINRMLLSLSQINNGKMYFVVLSFVSFLSIVLFIRLFIFFWSEKGVRKASFTKANISIAFTTFFSIIVCSLGALLLKYGIKLPDSNFLKSYMIKDISIVYFFILGMAPAIVSLITCTLWWIPGVIPISFIVRYVKKKKMLPKRALQESY